MNNVSDGGFTATVEPGQKTKQLDFDKERLKTNFARNGVGRDDLVPDEEITIPKGTELINSDSIPRSRIVPTGKLLSRKYSDSIDNADSSDIPKPLMSAVRAYKRLEGLGLTSQLGGSKLGMINLIGALLEYAKEQNLSSEETLKLYRKLNSDVIKSPLLEDAWVRTMDNFG